MAVLSFKNEQGRWEIVESPGALKYYKQTLADAEKAQARENIDVYSTSEIDDRMSLLNDFNEDIAALYQLINTRMPFPEDIDNGTVIPLWDSENEVMRYVHYSSSADPDAIAQRDGDGDIELPEQRTQDYIKEGMNYAVSGSVVKQFIEDYTYSKSAIDSLIGDIETALDEIIALQDYYTGATFDELHEYAINVAEGGAQ